MASSELKLCLGGFPDTKYLNVTSWNRFLRNFLMNIAYKWVKYTVSHSQDKSSQLV